MSTSESEPNGPAPQASGLGEVPPGEHPTPATEGSDGAPRSESPFSESEVAAAVEGPRTDPELEDVDAAEIDASEPETSFDKLVAKARRLKPAQIRNIIESLLFVSQGPLTVDQLVDASGIERAPIARALEELQGLRREGLAGIVLSEVAGGWQFRTAPESADCVRRLLKVKPQRLTRAALETMAIIAYRQPVTRPEIEDIRGVDSAAVIKALLDHRMIKIVGKKEEVGRPILYGTTREFLEFFALKDLGALPTLREFHELTAEHQDIVEKEAPAKPGAAGTVEALLDLGFKEKLKASDAASEAALSALEHAIDAADETSRAAARVLDPAPPPEPLPAEGETPSSGPGSAPT